MRRSITDEFAHVARELHASGHSKRAIGRAYGYCYKTVLRALQALAASGAAHTVEGYLLPEKRYAPRLLAPVDPNAPAQPGQECSRMLEALAREAAPKFLPAYA